MILRNELKTTHRKFKKKTKMAPKVMKNGLLNANLYQDGFMAIGTDGKTYEAKKKTDGKLQWKVFKEPSSKQQQLSAFQSFYPMQSQPQPQQQPETNKRSLILPTKINYVPFHKTQEGSQYILLNQNQQQPQLQPYHQLQFQSKEPPPQKPYVPWSMDFSTLQSQSYPSQPQSQPFFFKRSQNGDLLDRDEDVIMLDKK